jgi:hypothetical protein
VTKEMKEAWYSVVAKTSSLMIEGAQEAQAGLSGWITKYVPSKGKNDIIFPNSAFILFKTTFSLSLSRLFLSF